MTVDLDLDALLAAAMRASEAGAAIVLGAFGDAGNVRTKGPGDWVSELKDDQVTVTFGPLKAAKSRAATLYFQVGGTLLENTVLSARAFYNWSAEGSDGAGSARRRGDFDKGNRVF